MRRIIIWKLLQKVSLFYQIASWVEDSTLNFRAKKVPKKSTNFFFTKLRAKLKVQLWIFAQKSVQKSTKFFSPNYEQSWIFNFEFSREKSVKKIYDFFYQIARAKLKIQLWIFARKSTQKFDRFVLIFKDFEALHIWKNYGSF